MSTAGLETALLFCAITMKSQFVFRRTESNHRLPGASPSLSNHVPLTCAMPCFFTRHVPLITFHYFSPQPPAPCSPPSTGFVGGRLHGKQQLPFPYVTAYDMIRHHERRHVK